MAADHFQSLTVLFFGMANPLFSPALCEILRNSPSIPSIHSIPSIAAALHSCLHRILRHGRKNGDGSREGARESFSERHGGIIPICDTWDGIMGAQC